MSPEFDALIHQHYEFYKGMGFIASAVLVISLQILVPNRLEIQDLLKSWKVNLPLAFINLFLLFFICGACVSALAVSMQESKEGLLEYLGFSYGAQIVLTIFVLDLVAYGWHRANHNWPVLWRFHSVHHSDSQLDATTAVRFHAGELLISLGIRLVVVLIFGFPVSGLIIFEIIYGFFNLLVHSDLYLCQKLNRFLSLGFVTPSLHLLHHSVNKKEHHRNYGTIFSFWDRMFCSYLEHIPGSTIRVGLVETGKDLPLKSLLLLPFVFRSGIKKSTTKSVYNHKKFSEKVE